MTTVYLFEVTAAVDAAGTQRTFYYASGTGYNDPTAPAFYDGRIVQAGNFSRTVVDDLKTFGSSAVGIGEIVIANADGILDVLATYGYTLEANLLIGDDSGIYSAFSTWLKGKIEQPVFDFDTIVFRLRDRTTELDVQVQSSVFAGTNSGSTGIEGLPADIKGRTKPRIFGICYNIAPVLLNSASLIFGVNFDAAGATAAVNSFDAIYEGGNLLTLDTGVGTGGDTANLAALQAAVITAGKYATCKAAGLFRLGSSPSLLITADVTENGTAANNHAPTLIKRLLLDAGVASGDISSSDVTTLESAAGYNAGVYILDQSNYRNSLDILAGSIGAWYAPDKTGVYRIKQILNPGAGSSVFTFKRYAIGVAAKADESDIVAIERIASRDPGRGVPCYQVTLNYKKNWTVMQGGDIAGAVTDAYTQFLQLEYRSVVSTDGTISNQFDLAPQLTFYTVLTSSADAAAEVARRLAIYKVLRDTLLVTTTFDAILIDAIDLGSIVTVELDRFGYDAGKKFLIIGMDYNAAQNTVTLTLWG